jgi:glycosyltransferase involved in cell wall biosynthesis
MKSFFYSIDSYNASIRLRDSGCCTSCAPIDQEKAIFKKIIVICHSYNNFQKDSIEELSEYFNKINVLVRTNPVAEIANYLYVPQLEIRKKSYKIDLSHKPLNINVIPTPLWYLPCDRIYKSLGEKHFNAVKMAILHNRITFDFIHAHFTWSAGYVGARLKEEYGLPFVVTAHGYDTYYLPFKDAEWREKIEYVLESANHIVTVSQSNFMHLKKLKISTPISIIPNGFRDDLFRPRDPFECRKKLNLPQDKRIILTVGSLEPVKGQKYLVEAVQKMIKERENILCVIVGAGKLRKALERQIGLLGLKGYVMLVGGRSHDEVPLWMNACDLFVLPSLNEGNPTVMFEALGCGKPFVGTGVGGIPEIIINNKLGILLEPKDAEGLAQAILKALEVEWDVSYIQNYSMQFTWKNIAKQVMKVYETVMKNQV